MAREQKVLLVENRKALRLFLSAIIQSVNKDASVLNVTRISEARRLILKHKDLDLVLIGLETYSDARKKSLLLFLAEHSPHSEALVIYEHQKPSASLLKMTLAGNAKKKFQSCSVELEGCRAAISRLLKLNK